MIFLKVLSAGIVVLLQELCNWLLGKSIFKAMDELLYRNFRRSVVLSYSAPCEFLADNVPKALRELKQELLQLETHYEKLHRILPNDLKEQEHLRYCDEREAVEKAVQATVDFAAHLLALVYEGSWPCDAWDNREAVAKMLPEIWEAWYYRTLPIEIQRVLEDEQTNLVNSERFSAGNYHRHVR